MMHFHKLVVLTVLVLLISHNAVRAEPSKDNTFTLSNEDVDLIWSALAELPWKKAAPVMNKIKTQWDAQQPKPKPEPK